MQTPTPTNPFGWFSDHWAQMLGWSALLTFLYRAYIGLRKLLGFGDSIEATRTDMTTLMTNHLPHFQMELEKINENLIGLRGDLKDNFNRLSDDLRIVLTRMS